MAKKAKSKQAKKGLTHHAKRIYHMTPKFVHGMMVGGFIGLVGVFTLGAVAPAAALTLKSPRDCDSNAVINCGALTTTELKSRYNNKGVPAIYSYFGISAGDISASDTTAVAGRVYKNGKVIVNGTTVATSAITAGRENISGSTKVTSGGATFYTRPPSVSFRAESIASFVVMKDGQFKYAIIASCGNPVKATPIPKTPDTPPPPSTPPPVEDVPEVIEEIPDVPDEVSTQTPESTPTPVVTASTTTVTTLPNAGPGAVVLIAVFAIVGGYIFHATHRHIRRKRTTHHHHSA